jgi:hypothetical protein
MSIEGQNWGQTKLGTGSLLQIQACVGYWAVERGVVAAMEREAPISEKLAHRAIRMAQNRAQRLTYKQRQSVLRVDTWLEDSLSVAGNAEIDV